MEKRLQPLRIAARLYLSLLLLLWQPADQCRTEAFQRPIGPWCHQRLVRPPPPTYIATRPTTSATVVLHAKSRKARRMQKVERSRPQAFYDAIEETKKSSKERPADTADAVVVTKEEDDDEKVENKDPREAEREARAERARQQMEARPEVSTMIVDEETGIEVVAQGKSVMDVVTRKAVKLAATPELRLAQLFPGVPPNVREKYRLDWSACTVPTMVAQLRDACTVPKSAENGSSGGSRGLPTHPSVTNRALDFVLANRDLLGHRMKKTLGRLTMREMSLGNEETGRDNQMLWKHFMTIENHLSAPFRQIIMDAEGRVGPNFGNLDLQSFCDGALYERTANYLVLKGMVANWEKKVVDADFTERNPQTKDNFVSVMARGDPKRYLPDPPILFTLKECTQVCYMAQQMTKAFVETPELYNDLPTEVRFVEEALAVKGGTALRKFILDEYCPRENITPAALREGVRRLLEQLDNMQIDPYADLANLVERLVVAMAVGTDDERDPYLDYIANTSPNGPGAFQTYTFNHEKLSRVRFLDSQYEGKGGGMAAAGKSSTGGGGGGRLGDLFGGFGSGKAAAQSSSDPSNSRIDMDKYYKVPPARAAGRPHNLGWLDKLEEFALADENKLGKVSPGRIIPDDETAA